MRINILLTLIELASFITFGQRALCESVEAPDGVIAAYDMCDSGEFWSLPVTFGRETHQFWVDTGTGLTICDESLHHLLAGPAKEVMVQAMGGDVNIPRFVLADASVGALPFERKSLVGALDLSALRESAGAEVVGVLGCAFLRRYVVQFDYEHAYMRFLTNVPEAAGAKVPFDGDDIRPRCRCSVDDKSDDSFFVDSGFVAISSITLQDQIFNRLAAGAKATGSVVQVPPLIRLGTETTCLLPGAEQKNSWGLLRRLDLAELAFERVRVLRARFSMLGLRFLSRFVVTIDFPHRMLYFSPIEGAERDDFDAGVIIQRKGKRTLIRGVVPASDADGIGLSPGDEIARVNGTNTERTNIFALRRMLGRKGQTKDLEIKRLDGTELTVRIGDDGP